MFWSYFEFSLNGAAEYVRAGASVQRHMLVFNSQAMHIRWKRYVYHHIPLIICVFWQPIYYLGLIIFYPGGVLPSERQCDYDYTMSVCGYQACYLTEKLLGILDWTLANLLPIFIILIANIALIIRVVLQKQRLKQGNVWRKQRRMTIQLIVISALLITTWFPSVIVAVAQSAYDPSFLGWYQTNIFVVFIYLQPLLMPLVIAGQLSDVIHAVDQFIGFNLLRRQNHILPLTQAYEMRT